MTTAQTLESFTVRSADRWDYATFVILQRPSGREDGSGYFMLAIESSYGSGYAYAWSHPGQYFKRFLCGADAYYLRGKLAPGNTFDPEATTKEVRLHIQRERLERSLSAERARELWDSASFEDVSEFQAFISYASPDITDAWELGRKCPDARGRDFIALHKAFWPAFCEQLMASMQATAEAV